jgi:hypothetical protein
LKQSQDRIRREKQMEGNETTQKTERRITKEIMRACTRQNHPSPPPTSTPYCP